LNEEVDAVADVRAEGTVRALALEPLQRVLLHDAVDRSPALVFVADEEMRYLAVNNTACEVLGYTRQELLSLSVTDVAVSVEAKSLYQEMLSARSQQGDVELRTKEGVLLPFVYDASEVTVGGMQHWVSVGFVNLRLFDKVDQLETALLSRVVIEQAKGILAGRHTVDLGTAFAAIRSASRSNNLGVKELCRRVIEDAETPPVIARQLRRSEISKAEPLSMESTPMADADPRLNGA
jgi:PAS domain S-box-containing protein